MRIKLDGKKFEKALEAAANQLLFGLEGAKVAHDSEGVQSYISLSKETAKQNLQATLEIMLMLGVEIGYLYKEDENVEATRTAGSGN